MTLKLTPKQIEVLDMLRGNPAIGAKDATFLCGRGAGKAMANLTRKRLAFEDLPTAGSRHLGMAWCIEDRGTTWLDSNIDQVNKVRENLGLGSTPVTALVERVSRVGISAQPRPRTADEIFGTQTTENSNA